MRQTPDSGGPPQAKFPADNARARPLVGQFLRYGIVGILNTIVGLGVILALQSWIVGPYLANAGGYAIGLAVSFALNRGWTFSVHDRVPSRAIRFLLTFAVAYGVNIVALHLLLTSTEIHEAGAQAVSICLYSAIFFVLCRWVVFRPSPAA